MEHIKLNNKLKVLDKIGEISKYIIEKIQSMPNYQELRNDVEIILYVCTLIENELQQTKTKSINKKEIVIDIINKIFSLKPEEFKNIDKNIEFLHSNNLIKKISNYEKIPLQMANWFFRKFC